MKALSLTQPYATLVAIGAKQIETQSWGTSYLGLIAIHAAKGFPRDCRERCGDPDFVEALRGSADFARDNDRPTMLVYKGGLPLGAIVAIARIIGCRRTETVRHHLSDDEALFGDYGDGRFAWLLSDVRRLREPIPCKGALGVWDVNQDVRIAVEAQLREVRA